MPFVPRAWVDWPDPDSLLEAADMIDLENRLSAYTDAVDTSRKTYVDNADALKADKAYVDAADALKASKTYVDAQDATKADKTYVDSQDTALQNQINQRGYPIGAPMPWLVNAIPAGYLEFNGQAIAAGTYPVLASLFGANLPDLRDMFLVGASGTKAVASTGGEETHTLTVGEMPSHRHKTNMRSGGTVGALNANDLAARMNGGGTSGLVDWSGGMENVGGGGPHNNLPPFFAVRWITIAG